MEYSEKTGKWFIAYKGVDINLNDIVSALRNICPQSYTVRSKIGDNLIFSKIVYADYEDDRDPHWEGDTGILTVNGYIQSEIRAAVRAYSKYSISDEDRYQRLTNYMYREYKTDFFEKLKSYMHFCSAVWDRNTNSLIAGVSEPINEFTHLYYGYTRKNSEVMFSNNKELLKQFCEDIVEMEPNTYMRNGEIFTLDGRPFKKDTSLIKNTRENATSLIEGLNALLVQVTDSAVRAKIEENVEAYLLSQDPKKKISDYVFNELDKELKTQILQIIRRTIEEYSIEHEITTQLNELFNEKLSDYASQITVPITHIIKLNDVILGKTQGGFYHERFEQILTQTQLDEPIMLIGPAGSGKNVAISQVADALGLHMYYTNNASNEFKLTGFIDAGGNYRDTEFYKAFKNGGVFFLDEIDNSDPSALIVINSALANGYMAFPHETIDRHPDFRIIAAANTWGKGADLQYVGRNALDGATLDRFDNIFFDYDKNLEQALYPNDEVLQFMWAFRNAVYQSKVPHIVSTRGIGKVYKKEINGIPVPYILTSNVIKNLGQDDINVIIGNMQDIRSDNKFYEGIKQLRLSR
ncbi:MAG: AAA domain-containing protein [Bacilli bacterium]|nr:AAA domain-containing protein [Bacilli bacterium]